MKELNPLPFSYLLTGLGLLFLTVFYIWQARKKRRPSKLNLKAPKTLDEGEGVVRERRWSSAKELNAVIEFGGKQWDAFEVLGLPAGSLMEDVERAYAEKMERTSVVDKILVTKAYRAIKELG